MGEVMASILSGLRPQTSTGCGAEPSGQVSRLVEADGLGLRLRVSAGLAPASPVQSGLRDPRTVHRADGLPNKAGEAVGGPSGVSCYPPTVTRPRASAPGRPRPAASLLFDLDPASVRGVVALSQACGSAQGTDAPSASTGSAPPAVPSDAITLGGTGLDRSGQPGSCSGAIRAAIQPPDASPSADVGPAERLHRAPMRTGRSTDRWLPPSTGRSTARSCRAAGSWRPGSIGLRAAAGWRSPTAGRAAPGSRSRKAPGAPTAPVASPPGARSARPPSATATAR